MSFSWTDRRLLGGAVAGVLVLIAVLFGMRETPEDDVALVETPSKPIEETAAVEHTLYLPGADGLLHPVSHELPEGIEPAEKVAHLVEALLVRSAAMGASSADDSTAPVADADSNAEGESTATGFDVAALDTADLAWPLPPGITLGAAYLLDDATAVVDLVAPRGIRPSTGSASERLVIYSLVNTVTLNLEEAQRVLLLWDGQQPNTFAGHFDTTHPITPDAALIGESLAAD